MTDSDLAALTPAGLALRSTKTFQLPRHLADLNRRLVRLGRGELTRLLVLMPPRHGKSTMCSQYFPAWYLGRNPDKQVMLATYEADFAATWGRKARDVLEDIGGPVFDLGVRDDSSAANRWGIQGHYGGMQTSGVGGPMTGKGADVLIIDDPVKNDAEANSSTYREHVWEWFRSTAYTRLEPGGSILLVMTHWHQDDLAGRIMKEIEEGGEQWEVVTSQAIAEEDQPGRLAGEALWPSRYSVERLEVIRRVVGPYWWLSLYQQRPTKPQGTVFQLLDFRYFHLVQNDYILGQREEIRRWPKNRCWVFCTVDTAETMGKRSDYTVVATWAVTPDSDLLLLDVVRVRLETPDITPLLQQVNEKWNPGYIGVEGQPVYQQARRTGLPVRRLRPDKDKWTRAQPASARMSSHSIYFLAGAPWLSDLEEELLSFPTGAHDDQVDVIAYAALEIQKGRTDPGKLQVEIL